MQQQTISPVQQQTQSHLCSNKHYLTCAATNTISPVQQQTLSHLCSNKHYLTCAATDTITVAQTISPMQKQILSPMQKQTISPMQQQTLSHLCSNKHLTGLSDILLLDSMLRLAEKSNSTVDDTLVVSPVLTMEF